MSSIQVRTRAALVAVAAVAAMVAALSLTACSTPAESTRGGEAGSGIPETPVITGEPASYNDDDVSFASNMVTHHRQAIELSKLVSGRSTNPELAALASQIAAEQQPEINIMNVLLVQWNENPEVGTGSGGDDHTEHGSAMQGMVDDATMAELKTLNGTEFDTLWLKSMISHHQGAIEMAQAEIANGANVDAVAMAKAMVTSQEAEIQQMKRMLEGSKP